jgi:hypothetical protein
MGDRNGGVAIAARYQRIRYDSGSPSARRCPRNPERLCVPSASPDGATNHSHPGIFIFVVNGLMLLLVNDLVHGFHVDSFGSAFWGAILISFVSWILSAFFRGSDGRVHPLTHHRQMRRVEGRVVASSKPGES